MCVKRVDVCLPSQKMSCNPGVLYNKKQLRFSSMILNPLSLSYPRNTLLSTGRLGNMVCQVSDVSAVRRERKSCLEMCSGITE